MIPCSLQPVGANQADDSLEALRYYDIKRTNHSVCSAEKATRTAELSPGVSCCLQVASVADLRQPLGIESVPLVESLLSDLVVTSENYESLREAYQQVDSQNKQLSNVHEPVRRENARLTSENEKVGGGAEFTNVPGS